MIKSFIWLNFAIFIIWHDAHASPYERGSYEFKSYKASTDIGFYTQKKCAAIDIDHVVSLKDAHESGAFAWSDAKKKRFANDVSNHVPSCASVNRSKGSSNPFDFLRKSRDGKGIDYQIVSFCEYLKKYYAVKITYGLSFNNNNKQVFDLCGLQLLE